MSYRLFDIATKHMEEPQGFSIPRAEERYWLQPGEVVSVGLTLEDSVTPEWCWVRIEKVLTEGRYIGSLGQKPLTIESLDAGYRIEFGAEHIYEIYVQENDPRWIDQSKLALVSGHIANESAYPGRIMRIPPMAPGYSGWMVFSGTEEPEYLKEFSNFVSMPLDVLIRQFPNLASVMASPTGSEWKWNAEIAEYSK